MNVLDINSVSFAVSEIYLGALNAFVYSLHLVYLCKSTVAHGYATPRG